MLPLSEWKFKADEGHSHHLGPMAQDFYAAFNLGEDERHISTVDFGGVALAAIQGLNEKVETRGQAAEIRIQKSETENAELKRTVNALKELVQAMNHKLNGGAE